MTIRYFYDLLEKKECFIEFKKDYPDAFLFLIFGFLSKNEKEQDKISFDFFSPEKNKIIYFDYPFLEKKISEEKKEINKKEIKIEEIKVDICDLWDIIENKKNEENIDLKIEKFFAVLNGNTWTITGFNQFLNIVKIEVDAKTKNIKNFEINKIKDLFKKEKANL